MGTAIRNMAIHKGIYGVQNEVATTKQTQAHTNLVIEVK